MKANTCSEDCKRKNFPEDVTDSDDSDGPVSKTLKEYGGATTIHGIPYILEDGRRAFERFLWIFLVIASAGFTYHSTYTIYWDWQNNPVTTTIGTTGLNIENIDYPSITICAQGSVKEITGNLLNLKELKEN